MRRRIWGVAPVLAVLILTGTGCQGMIDRLKANYAVKQGNDFYKAQDFLKAVEWYRYATYLNPDLPIAYYNTGLAYVALYKPGSMHPKDLRYAEEAIENLQRYLNFDSNNQDAKNYLLTIYLGAERYDEAGVFFEKEFKDHSDDPAMASELAQRLGMIYAKKGDFESSLEWYKKRADIEKDSPEALYTIGVLCWDKVYHSGLLLEIEKRQELTDAGLDYLKRAAEMKENYFEAVSYINLLYREKAKLAAQIGNNEDVAKYNAEADKSLKLALEMRKKVMASK
jgi:tetratricopeptide (TPR) repeat protein